MALTLLTEAVKFRGQTYTVRELDADQFVEWAQAIRLDPKKRLHEAARLGTVDPPLTAEQIATAPAALIVKLAGKILDLSEIDTDPKVEAEPSETSTD